MGPHEVVETLGMLGVRTSLTTLRRYVRQGLVTPPRVRSLGKGRGKESEYAMEAVYEAYAAAHLLGRALFPHPMRVTLEGIGTFELPTRAVTVKDVRNARELAYKAGLKEHELPPVTPETTDEEFFLLHVASQWIKLWRGAKDDLNYLVASELTREKMAALRALAELRKRRALLEQGRAQATEGATPRVDE